MLKETQHRKLMIEQTWGVLMCSIWINISSSTGRTGTVTVKRQKYNLKWNRVGHQYTEIKTYKP